MGGKPSIGIIGDGNVGKALAEGLRRQGYAVETTGHDPERVREVAERAEMLILAVPHGERRNALRAVGQAAHAKVLVDVTNTVGPDMGFAGRTGRSSAEEVQSWARKARVVKAFNTVFAQHMSSGMVDGEPLTVPLAADDASAKAQVAELAQAIGFEPADAGPLENARWLEALGYLNIRLAYQDPKVGPGFGLRWVGRGAPKGPQGPREPERGPPLIT